MYYIEQELINQADIYKQTFSPHGSDGPSAKWHAERNGRCIRHGRRWLLSDFLIKHLREGVRNYARHECQECRIDQQAGNNMVSVYRLHQRNGSKITSTMYRLWSASTSAVSWKTGMRPSVTTEEAYKSWQYFKRKLRDLTDQLKKFWAKELVYHNVHKVFGQTDLGKQRRPTSEQSDQGLHCLQFPLHLLDAFL